MSPKKYFTVDQANRALQLVEPVVSDIVTKRKKALEITTEVKKLRQKKIVDEKDPSMADWLVVKGYASLNIEDYFNNQLGEAEKLLEDIEYHLDELAKIGCFLKDIDEGMVDFPALHKGHEVMLCWKSGEKTVEHWHDNHTGSKTRKIIDEAFKKTSQPTLI